MFPTNFFIDADKTSSTSIVATFVEKVKSVLALIPSTTKNTEIGQQYDNGSPYHGHNWCKQ